MFKNNYVKPVLRLKLTTIINAIVDNDVKPVITFINLTCIIKLKINVSWNNTPL